ncbi:MAG TPA: phosphomannomutase CpsG [Steroidobacteraceae bacterium]|nr:phosphomannomutase CpsG [Steroidobacteraceae bacterium]
MPKLTAFKAYDIRGRLPEELNESLAYDVGRAYAAFVKPQRVCLGHDIRLSSPALASALARGLTECGVEVLDIGLWGTEGVYFATAARGLDGGIMVTASHNPPDYNGLKLVREGSRPVSADTGLGQMQALIEEHRLPAPAARAGHTRPLDVSEAYLSHLLGYIDRARLRRLKVVVNAGNGGAGLIIDRLEPHLPFEFVKIHHRPDGHFPHGVPNPMLEENRASTREAVLSSGADVGLAWDGDYDRCFFFDEQGRFIEGYYLVGVLAEVFLQREPGARIVHDPRLTWNTLELVRRHGGVPVLCKSGHAFIKQKMREVDAAYGGEMSAHHYFRQFFYCDSGMIPWLLVLQVLSERGVPLSELVGSRMRAYPASGEINLALQTPAHEVLARIRRQYEPGALAVDFTDGLSIEFAEWRFNLRASNTEPLVRLNVEARGSEALMRERTAQLLERLRG